MITRNRQSATLTVMPSLAQCLRIRRSTHASLRRTTGGHFHQHTTSLCRFVRELCDERRPSGVIYRPGQHSSGQTLNVQLFNDYQPEQKHESSRYLVREILPLITHMRVDALQISNGFLPVITASLATGNLTLRPSEFGLGFFVVSGVFNLGSIRQRGKGAQANVKAGFFGRSGQSLRFAFDAEHGIPFSGVALDGDGFDLAFDWAMQFNLDGAYALQSQFAVVEHFAAVAVSRKGNAVVATDRVKSRITWRLAVLDAIKERIESPINATQHILATREVGKSQIARGANLFQLIGLIVIVDRVVRDAISVAALLNGGVVEAAGFSQLAIKRGNLRAGRVESVFEVLFDYNLISHCGSRRFRDAALVRLVIVLPALLRAVSILLQVAEFKKGIARSRDARFCVSTSHDAKSVSRLQADNPLSRNLWISQSSNLGTGRQIRSITSCWRRSKARSGAAPWPSGRVC